MEAGRAHERLACHNGGRAACRLEERAVLYASLRSADDYAALRLEIKLFDERRVVIYSMQVNACNIRMQRRCADTQYQIISLETLSHYLYSVLVNDSCRGVQDIFKIKLLFGLPIHESMGR